MHKLSFLFFAIITTTASYSQTREIANEAYIKQETIGGKLDYIKQLDNDKQTLYMHGGYAYNKKDFAIFLWSKQVKSLGITSAKKAARLWEEINNRELTKPERKALDNGFEEKIES